MQIYLPIAELSVQVFLILGMGGAVGFLSGLFGVGGGFLITPLLMFAGIPPTVAVATAAPQLLASSVSGVLAHWRRGNVDFQMGGVLTVGGLIGSVIGTQLFALLKALGQVELAISLLYVGFLGVVGGMMLWESGRAMLRTRAGTRPARRKLHAHSWVHGMPLKMRFRKSRLYISALLPVALGALVGLLAALMGVGGGFIMIPLMVYVLSMPTQVVIGTSLLQIGFVTAAVTFLHATDSGSVDIVLAILLLVGSVVGAQFGARAGTKLKGEQLRALLGLLVVAVAVRLGVDLVVRPVEPFSIQVLTSE
ncbi:sulfite exporter TauE/SafE family protein [Zavarzinia sp. CC-PAN008]|uniref:sulfite exporter TauE/SafE family protein n=1 Tax=Zavarzinia sp. CC-PAN008 TaxID=3243332 RepID=UPI003F74572A